MTENCVTIEPLPPSWAMYSTTRRVVTTHYPLSVATHYPLSVTTQLPLSVTTHYPVSHHTLPSLSHHTLPSVIHHTLSSCQSPHNTPCQSPHTTPCQWHGAVCMTRTQIRFVLLLTWKQVQTESATETPSYVSSRHWKMCHTEDVTWNCRKLSNDLEFTPLNKYYWVWSRQRLANILYTFFSFLVHATCPIHTTLDFTILPTVWWKIQIMELIMQFFPASH
jgi:hypothetical protein